MKLLHVVGATAETLSQERLSEYFIHRSTNEKIQDMPSVILLSSSFLQVTSHFPYKEPMTQL
jgi:hypothetical protein